MGCKKAYLDKKAEVRKVKRLQDFATKYRSEQVEKARINALMNIGQVKYGSCSSSTSYKVEKLSEGEKVMFWWIDSYGVPSEHGLILESDIKEVAEGYSQW